MVEVMEMRESASGDKGILAIGTTGHRALPFDMALILNIDISLRGLFEHHDRIEIISPLAEGADRLLTKQPMELVESCDLTVLLPMDMDDYLDDFESEGSSIQCLHTRFPGRGWTWNNAPLPYGFLRAYKDDPTY